MEVQQFQPTPAKMPENRDWQPVIPPTPPWWRKHWFAWALLLILMVGSGITAYLYLSGQTKPVTKTVANKVPAKPVANAWKGTIDPHNLPLGDGNVSST